jgi:hypothetical protein
MPLKTRLVDGRGTGREANVTTEHALLVSVVPSNPKDVDVEVVTRNKVYRDKFKDALLNEDLNVDGSVTVKQFFIQAEVDKAKWVTSVRFVFNDANMELVTNDFRRFGTAATSPGLINGIRFHAEQGGIITEVFFEYVKTIGAFMNYADKYVNFNNAISAVVDFLSFDFDFDEPVPLPDGTQDKLVITIQDDLTSVDLFQVFARGYQVKL